VRTACYVDSTFTGPRLSFRYCADRSAWPMIQVTAFYMANGMDVVVGRDNACRFVCCTWFGYRGGSADASMPVHPDYPRIFCETSDVQQRTRIWTSWRISRARLPAMGGTRHAFFTSYDLHRLIFPAWSRRDRLGLIDADGSDRMVNLQLDGCEIAPEREVNHLEERKPSGVRTVKPAFSANRKMRFAII